MFCLWSSVFFQCIFFPELPLEMKFRVDSLVPSDEMLHSQYKLHWGNINLGDIQRNTIFLNHTGDTFLPNCKNVCDIVGFVSA